jgi:diguanylate cyclase (GGDEF)-like protein
LKKELQNKLLNFNFFSIFTVGFIFILFFIPITYSLINNIIDTSNKLSKDFYIQTQKNLIKNQVNNFINYLKHLRKEKTKEIIDYIDNFSNIAAKNLKYSKNKINALTNFSKYNHINLAYVKNKKIIFSNIKNLNPSKINFSKKIQKIDNNYFIIKKIDNNEYLILSISQKIIDEKIKKEAIKYLYSIRFGAKNNGYISIAEILNYKGGKKFAKVVALPVKPEWVGKYLDDDKKDAKGKMYRKEYLQIINTTKEGFVSYWFFKKTDKKMHPKISYIKLYKPYNWLVFSSVFLDDIDSVIKIRNEIFLQTIKKYIYLYLIALGIFFLIIFILVKYENKIFKKLINEYEKEIEEKNKKLQKLNTHLSNLVQQKTKEILEKYFTDQLTGLPNREKLISECKDKYIAIFNINSFKEINDFYGIDIGDKILKEIAKILTFFSNNVYKLSADEYAITDNTPEKLANLAKKINDYLSKNPITINNEKIYISFRVGIGKNLQEADLALKYSKRKNKKFIIVFNKKLPILKEFENNIQWKNIIYEAIKNDNIIPYIQPIIDNKTKKVIKYECLARLKYNGKIYTPYFFLDIARKTNQYETIQKIIIEKCFKKFSQKQKNFSINLDLLDLENEQFKKWLLDQIDEYNVSKLLTIELLENQNIINNEETKSFIKALKEKNVKVAIDDFGSGYSNFVYFIKDLPTDILKIDGSIVKDIHKEEIYTLLAKITEIAKTFNFITIAEFVENEEIYKKLLKIGVDLSQGYYFSKPFDINEL